MMADMEANKKLKTIVDKLFIGGRKLNISVVFLSQSYFALPKTIRLNVTHYFTMKISNKRELQKIALNHSSNTEFRNFIKFYKNFTKEPFSFLVNDKTYQ